MTIKRYTPGTSYASGAGVPDIVESPHGEYVLFSDHQRLLAACAAHGELLLGRLRLAERTRGALSKEAS